MTVLFGVALVGVALVVGIALSNLGPLALLAYVLLLAAGALALVRRVRALRPADDDRTCTCCTSTVHDPVEVR